MGAVPGNEGCSDDLDFLFPAPPLRGAPLQRVGGGGEDGLVPAQPLPPPQTSLPL